MISTETPSNLRLGLPRDEWNPATFQPLPVLSTTVNRGKSGTKTTWRRFEKHEKYHKNIQFVPWDLNVCTCTYTHNNSIQALLIKPPSLSLYCNHSYAISWGFLFYSSLLPNHELIIYLEKRGQQCRGIWSRAQHQRLHAHNLRSSHKLPTKAGNVYVLATYKTCERSN